LMAELDWVPVRARSVTARGRASRVRGYARMRKGGYAQPNPTQPCTITPSDGPKIT
jgi:hypothetical protein